MLWSIQYTPKAGEIRSSWNNTRCARVPGKSLCRRCWQTLIAPQSNFQLHSWSDNQDDDFYISDDKSATLSLNTVLQNLEVAPLELKKLATYRRPLAVKRKLEEATTSIKSKMSSAYIVDFSDSDSDSDANNKLCGEYLQQLEALKVRMKFAKTEQEKINYQFSTSFMV